MAKNIVFCSDGTCNGPGDPADRRTAAPTNVFKLFLRLDGKFDGESISLKDEQESELSNAAGVVTQAAKYIHGVGDATNPIVKLLGGALGVGLVARIVRGYTYLSRNYKPGDRIYLVGFSRGAYTVRALAGLIRSKGLLDPSTYDPLNPEEAYRLGAAAWYDYQQTVPIADNGLAMFQKFVLDLPGFLGSKPKSYVKNVSIQAIGVWDTVGSYGLTALYDATGSKVDLMPLADDDLDDGVINGFHAISLDEQRDAFVPLLWNPRAGVVQRLFPGVHADVGGGYVSDGGEAGLSDGALAWMAGKLGAAGVFVSGPESFPEAPNPLAPAHQQWRYPPWTGTNISKRRFVGRVDLEIDPAIATRHAAASVIFDPGKNTGLISEAPVAGKYAPTNLP